MKQYRKHLLICEMGGNCRAKGAEGLGDMLKNIIEARGLKSEVKVTKTACIGACGFGPNLVIYPDGLWYYGVQQADLARIIDESVVGGRIIDELLFHKHGDPSVAEVVKDPVCGMIFRVHEAACSEVLPERTVYFCCESCRQAYVADPAAYSAKKHGHQAVSAGHDGHHGH